MNVNKFFLFLNSVYGYQQLSKIIEDIDFKYAIIKGEITSIYAYGKTGARYCNDIDILIDKKNLNKFTEILHKNNFLQIDSNRLSKIVTDHFSHQTLPYYKGNIGLDVNYDLFWGEYDNNRIIIDDFLEDTIEKEIYGVVVKCLPPYKAFLHLLLHGYKDLNSIFMIYKKRKIDILIFKEIFDFFLNHKNSICCSDFKTIVNVYKIQDYVFYMLYYTNKIFYNKDLHMFSLEFKTSNCMHFLECYGLSESERKKWNLSFEERLNSENLYLDIKSQLTNKDFKKIKINENIF